MTKSMSAEEFTRHLDDLLDAQSFAWSSKWQSSRRELDTLYDGVVTAYRTALERVKWLEEGRFWCYPEPHQIDDYQAWLAQEPKEDK